MYYNENCTMHGIIFYGITVIILVFSMPVSSAEKKVLFIDTQASCIATSCHDDMGKKKFVHAAGLDPMNCTRCHKILREGEHTFKSLPADTILLCAQCHSKDIVPPKDLKGTPPKVISEDNKELNLHEPFAKGKCTDCHDAHESNYFKQLKAAYPEGTYETFSIESYALCLNANCHKGYDKALTEPRTLSDTKFRNGNLNLHFRHVNKPKGRTCRTCHENHGSGAPFLINETLQFGKAKLTLSYEKTDSGGGCNTSCHRIAKYDRYSPVQNIMRTTPPVGEDATEEELTLGRERESRQEREATMPEGEKN